MQATSNKIFSFEVNLTRNISKLEISRNTDYKQRIKLQFTRSSLIDCIYSSKEFLRY